MIKVKGIKDFGTWLRIGETVLVNNNLGLHVVKKGYAKMLGYVDGQDKRCINKKEMENRIHLLKKYKIPMRQSYGLKFILDFLNKIDSQITSKEKSK